MFQTERLLIRHWRDSDLAALVEVYGDADAMRWVGDGEPLDVADCERWLAVTKSNYARRGYGMYAIDELASSAVVGFCGIVHPGDQIEPEIKYALRRTSWGRGFATEAVRGVLAYGREVLGLTRVIASIAPENAASRRVLTKVGMKATEIRLDENGDETQYFAWTS